jgi:hypothetical protein
VRCSGPVQLLVESFARLADQLQGLPHTLDWPKMASPSANLASTSCNPAETAAARRGLARTVVRGSDVNPFRNRRSYRSCRASTMLNVVAVGMTFETSSPAAARIRVKSSEVRIEPPSSTKKRRSRNAMAPRLGSSGGGSTRSITKTLACGGIALLQDIRMAVACSSPQSASRLQRV